MAGDDSGQESGGVLYMPVEEFDQMMRDFLGHLATRAVQLLASEFGSGVSAPCEGQLDMVLVVHFRTEHGRFTAQAGSNIDPVQHRQILENALAGADRLASGEAPTQLIEFEPKPN